MTDYPPPDALHMLLPFYVNGTLDPVQRGLVDAALARSSELRAELAEVAALGARLKKGGAEALTGRDETDQRLSALLARLPEPPAAPVAQPERMRLAAALAFLAPRRWAPAVGLSLVAALGMMGVLLHNSNDRTGRLERQLAQAEEKYRSASGPCETRPVAGRISLELQDGARWSQVSDLLDTERLTIVDSGGLGTLTVATAAKGEALDALVLRLRASPLVFSADVAK